MRLLHLIQFVGVIVFLAGLVLFALYHSGSNNLQRLAFAFSGGGFAVFAFIQAYIMISKGRP